MSRLILVLVVLIVLRLLFESMRRRNSDSEADLLSTKSVYPRDAAADDRGRDKGDIYTTKMASTIVSKSPQVSWDDLAGLSVAKATLRDAVLLPLKFPNLFANSGRRPWSGILMYGPPGTGKSLMAKAAVSEMEAYGAERRVTFLNASASDIMSKWQGESERLVRGLFAEARRRAPSVIFIDEIDSIISQRGVGGGGSGSEMSAERVKAEFLVQMQGLGSDNTGVLVLGATNLPWLIDEAARRRFERRIYFPLPDEATRLEMFKRIMDKCEHTMSEADFCETARATEGYSGSDLATLCQAALMKPVHRMQAWRWFKRTPRGVEMARQEEPWSFESDFFDLPQDVVPPPVDVQDVRDALNSTKPTVDADQLELYEMWTAEFGQSGV